MRRFFGEIRDGYFVVEGQEFIHLKNVLRLQEGDKFCGMNGDGFDYTCEIVQMSKKEALCRVLEKNLCNGNPQNEIVLFQAVPKKEHLDEIVEKATELGAAQVVLFSSLHSVNKGGVNMERLGLLARNSQKQCERAQPLKLCQKTFDEMLKMIVQTAKEGALTLFACERNGKDFDFCQIKGYKKINLIVGCEGGFIDEEKQKIIDTGAIAVSLGNRILRAETAAIVMLGLASLISLN